MRPHNTASEQIAKFNGMTLHKLPVEHRLARDSELSNTSANQTLALDRGSHQNGCGNDSCSHRLVPLFLLTRRIPDRFKIYMEFTRNLAHPPVPVGTAIIRRNRATPSPRRPPAAADGTFPTMPLIVANGIVDASPLGA